MTPAEAIQMLVIAEYSNDWQGNEELTTANIIACEALEKQIPRKPIVKVDENIWNCMDTTTEYCPSCQNHLIFIRDNTKYKPNYCPDCGQALDRSEEKQ